MPTIYGLNKDTIEQINAVFVRFPEIEKAILYGSRAKGNFKNGSDIDLTLVGDKINLTILNTISNALDSLFLPQIIDLSIYHHIDNKDLLEHISRVGILFYSKP